MAPATSQHATSERPGDGVDALGIDTTRLVSEHEPVDTRPDADVDVDVDVDSGPGPTAPMLLALQRVLARMPHWLPPVNVGAVVVLAWWSALGLERSSGGRHVGSTLTLVFGAALTVAVGIVVRALERIKELDDELRHIADDGDVDPLTGMMGRGAIALDIERRLAEPSDEALVGVLFCDLDRLKVVNDSFGHHAGDEVLRASAERLRRVLRSDDSIGRFGGDKFVIATSGLRTPRDLEVLADRLVGILAQPTAVANNPTQIVSGSVGIAWVSTGDPDGRGKAPAETAAELLRDADSAMQLAKGEGGGRYAVFDPSVRAQAVARLELEQDLRRGIESDELVVHYQPVLDVVTGIAHRFEALVRWNHPVRGMVHPADFLSVAAESNLIVDLGTIVLHRACHQAVRWIELTGRPITVSVNVAERQLLDPGLVGSVTRALAESGLPADQLELEITEELVMDCLDRTLLMLRQLELAGVRLVIDDFGTSQASLARLQSLAMVSTLKIDRVFVEGVANESIDRSVVNAIVTQADGMGMSIVAEGVEQLAQAEILRDLGVRYQQGFLHQRPGPAEAMTPHLDRLRDAVHSPNGHGTVAPGVLAHASPDVVAGASPAGGPVD
ncbi:MAG: bifunctional diguanylate cyclase/phosphodiesterase [Acidimicrobiia bacterium]|nr:bifunctional diguanylate cyclase/phosphodiesterase [Acidimicrobiia bacterium]